VNIDARTYVIYLLVMAGVTLFLRAVPFILLRKKLKSVFWSSFLAYVPYTVLSAMTVPAIFFATDSRITGISALVMAVIASLLGGGLVTVAAVSCLTVLGVDGLLLVL
jgi:branched-subunit amino acid transport protein